MTRFFIVALAVLLAASTIHAQRPADEKYRPLIHFTPKEKWMNDPNGLVYYRGIYHLFYQHNPNSSVWGPMHWGHATSKDLIHWKHEPIALFPDSLGTIFSGSAVVDKNNTSGFGKGGKVPIVAIYTQHLEAGEKAGRLDFQNQSIAYSLDNGKTWAKYAGNPVLKNPGMKDFRDPKVMWYEPTKRWILSLAAGDRIIFYTSPDLKTWTKQSEFGESAGAHGGVWECPDLFSLDYNGKPIWVLIVNINPGGPNKGSATQYFLGDFDGKKFSPLSTETKWLDYGPDEYAGVTWDNTGNRRIFLGWMSNWLYANVVPTETWRNAMTLPRELRIVKTGNDLRVASTPVSEITSFESSPVIKNNIELFAPYETPQLNFPVQLPCVLKLSTDKLDDIRILLSNSKGESVSIGYSKLTNQYIIDRSASGMTSFHKEFAAKHVAPRFITTPFLNLTLIVDVSSVELFADNGLTVMTEIFFPGQAYNKISISTLRLVKLRRLEYWKISKSK